MNATTLGCYSTRVAAVPRGALREDPDSVDDFVSRIVDGLAPRDHLERIVATNIALLILRAQRLCALEAEAIAGVAPSRLGTVVGIATDSPEDGAAVLRERGAMAAIEEVLTRTCRIDRLLSARLREELDRYTTLHQRPAPSDPEAPAPGERGCDETNPM